MLIHGASGGVGRFATQLARWRGAHVIGTASGGAVEELRMLGADEVVDLTAVRFEQVVAPVDLTFDTVGGDVLARSAGVIREGGRLVSVAEEPPAALGEGVETTYFVVEPSGEQLRDLAQLAEEGRVRPALDSVYPLTEARAAFERVMMRGKRGKVVLQVDGDR